MTFVAGRKGPERAPVPVSRLLPGDHACWLFRSPEEHRQGVTAFVRQGLERGGKVVYQADRIAFDMVTRYLRQAGLDPEGLVARGRLALLSLLDGEARHGVFDPSRQVGRYGDLLRKVKAEGHRGLWLTAESTWEIRGDIAGSEGYLEYERLVDELFAARDDAVFLCQYDASVVEEASATALRSVHNLELADADLRPVGGNDRQLRLQPTEEGMALSGQVDLATWAALRNGLTRLAAGAGGGDIVLDVGGLSFIDAHGMSLIAQTARELDHSRRLVLRGGSPRLIRTAEILGFDRLPGLLIEGDGVDGER